MADLGIRCTDSSVGDTTYEDGWALYDGKRDISSCQNDPCVVFRNNEKIDAISAGVTVQDDLYASDPPYRVYDYSAKPTTEDDLKYVSGNDPDKQYRLTCNKFIEVIDGNGENKAWANRISRNTLYATATPRFFVYPSGGEGTPYGSL